MVKVFRAGCLMGKPREPEEIILLADESSVKVEVADSHLFLYGDGDKVLHVIAPGNWIRVQIL